MNHAISEFDAACTSSKTNLLVVAPPGCGKTELLARRAEYLISQLSSGQKILALTFSNKARDNLKDRLSKTLSRERMSRYIEVRNFHGHAAEIVRSHGATLGVSTDYTLPDKRTQDNAIDASLNGLRNKDDLDFRRIVAEALRDAKQKLSDDAAVLKELERTNRYAAQVEKYRQCNDIMLYDDLLRHAQRLLHVDGIAHLYKCHYGAILVDEFQDLSPQQLDIALLTCATNRTFAGDPLQGIYSWTGTRPEFVEHRLREICGDPLGLGVSYRSSPRVLSLLWRVSGSLGGAQLLANQPGQWHDGGCVAGGAFSTAEAEAAAIRGAASNIVTRFPAATVGIICRNGWRRKEIDNEFLTTNTPCTRWDVEIDNPSIVEIIRNSLDRLGRTVTWERLTHDLLGSTYATDVETVAEIREALTQIQTLTGSHHERLADVLSQLRIRNSDEVIPAGIHLLNAHVGKGQQFDWVFIPGLEEGNIPSFHAKRDAALLEEHRVLLVMISRARTGVVVSRAAQRHSKAGKYYHLNPSRWCKELQDEITRTFEDLEDYIASMPSGNLSDD